MVFSKRPRKRRTGLVALNAANLKDTKNYYSKVTFRLPFMSGSSKEIMTAGDVTGVYSSLSPPGNREMFSTSWGDFLQNCTENLECANCQNPREQQNIHHPQDCNDDVQYGFCGPGARIVGFDFKIMQLIQKILLLNFTTRPLLRTLLRTFYKALSRSF